MKMSINSKQARKSLSYLIEDNRRKTFKKWVFSDNDVCNADKMAEAGFIFTGNKSEPDVVKCFLCDKTLDGWDSTDDPWKEHLKHAPKCSFARLQKPQDCITIKEFLNIKDELMEKIIISYCDNKADNIKEEFERYEDKILSHLESLH